MVLLLSERRNLKDTMKKSVGYVLSFVVMEELPIRSPVAGKYMALEVPPSAPPKTDSSKSVR